MNGNLKRKKERERERTGQSKTLLTLTHTILFSILESVIYRYQNASNGGLWTVPVQKNSMIWFVFVNVVVVFLLVVFCFDGSFWVLLKVCYFISFRKKKSFQAKNIVLNSIFFSFLSILASMVHTHTTHTERQVVAHLFFFVSRRTFSIFDTSLSIEMSSSREERSVLSHNQRYARLPLLYLLAIYSRHRSHF